jgi:hypothetical protein
MATNAKKLSVYLTILSMPWGLAAMGWAGRASWPRQGNNNNAALETDAAYRDGFFLGELDARQGRKARLSLSRWNAEKDRIAFKAGYELGYKKALALRSTEHRH